MQCLLSPEDVYDKDKDDYGQVLREGGGSGAEGQPEGQDPHLTGGLGRLCRGQVLQVKKFPQINKNYLSSFIFGDRQTDEVSSFESELCHIETH